MVFLDTACLIALIRTRDTLHQAAKKVMQDLERRNAPVVTSDWVVMESLNAASSPALRIKAAELVDVTIADDRADVVPASRDGLLEALAYYRSRRDKDWSLVDCSSMLICKARGIRSVFTHDRHFGQAGFEVLL